MFTLSNGYTLSGPFALDAYGGMTITTSSGASTLDGVTLNNHGSATWTGSGAIRASDGATINNLAGATFNAQADGEFTWDTSQSGPAPAFNNAGTFTRSGDSGATDIEIAFNNTGSVDVQAGFLHVGQSGSAIVSTSTGSFTGAAGTTLYLAAEDLTASSSIAGDTVSLSGVTDAGSYQAVSGTGANDVSFTGPILGVGNSIGIGGTVSFSPTSGGPVTLTTGALTVLPSGTLTGIDSFVVNGLFTLSDGYTLSGPFTIDAYGGMTITTSSGASTLDGVTLNNHGSATWTGSGAIRASDGATINNLAGATFNAQSDGEYSWDTSQSGPAPAFNNAGTFTRSGDSARPISRSHSTTLARSTSRPASCTSASPAPRSSVPAPARSPALPGRPSIWPPRT